MRYLKTKAFQRALKWHRVDDAVIKEVLVDIFKGRAIPLGHKIYKIRSAREDAGKRGGFRSLFFWKKDERIIFCLLFAKNEQDDLSPDDQKVLAILSREYDCLTDVEISERIEKNTLKEIKYER
ncbi:MAG: type II toxin-antitoxin system RelE/ParE family toxin [Candidatus Omnitrophica bacterium]|nr:type II toxin-antitoxin system RelE/ParE family toxin [Candidatus Omnitrophota bacterium]